MVWLHFKYVNAVVLFTVLVGLVWLFVKITNRDNPLDFKEYKLALSEIKTDIYGGA